MIEQRTWDAACVSFLESWLPRLGYRWAGYRKVHRTVGKRLRRRLRELGLSDLDAYDQYLHQHADEWSRLDALCRIPISRFWRDADVFETLGRHVLPELAVHAIGRDQRLACWCCGAASGEEPYSLRFAWVLGAGRAFPGVHLTILATDVDPVMLRRAAAACYRPGSLKELPEALLRLAFVPAGELLCIRPEWRSDVAFEQQDVRRQQPAGPFDLILCRNLVFTYFEPALQTALVLRMADRLRPGGCLVIGRRERLPCDVTNFAPWTGSRSIYRRLAS